MPNTRQVATAWLLVPLPLCQAINQRGSSSLTPTPYSQTTKHNCAPRLHDQAPPSANGRKKAVVIGISYKDTEDELEGCINDTKVIKKMLINRFKFPESSILVLTDDQTDPYRIPTKHNIRKAMIWLLQGCKPGDSLFFHFSGHGSQQKNDKGDEIDGYYETLLPSDFETNGMITDNEINAKNFRPLPPGVKLHVVIDACHSVTALDLPYLCRMKRNGKYEWEDHRPETGAWKGTHGEVFFFSGCDDHQLSGDSAGPGEKKPKGAMTSAFIQAIESGQTTYGCILSVMRSTIAKIESDQEQKRGPAKLNLKMLLRGGATLIQEPQLSSGKPFDVYTTKFSL